MQRKRQAANRLTLKSYIRRRQERKIHFLKINSFKKLI
mgnify:CR=1 FL=1